MMCYIKNILIVGVNYVITSYSIHYTKLYDNNIGFFANTKNAESLIEDVNRKIHATIEKIEMLKEKIRIIDEADDED